MRHLLWLICTVALLAGCQSSPTVYDPDKDPKEIEATQQLFSEEAQRIEPVRQYVQRQGRILSVQGDAGSPKIFTNTFDRRCGEFDCDWFSYEGLYADNQFFRVSSVSGEFWRPDYLVSRKSGHVTSLIGAVTDTNLSPDHRYIVNALGGDTQEDGIYVWQIEQGEIKQVYAYEPKGQYATYHVRGWLDKDTALIEDEDNKDERCKTEQNLDGYSKSEFELKSGANGWELKKVRVLCK